MATEIMTNNATTGTGRLIFGIGLIKNDDEDICYFFTCELNIFFSNIDVRLRLFTEITKTIRYQN